MQSMSNERLKRLPKFVTARRRWFVLGIGVKRWLAVLALGSAVAGMGLVYAVLFVRRLGFLSNSAVYEVVTLQWLPDWLAVIAPLILGGGLILWSLIRLGRTILEPFRDPDVAIADTLYEHQRRNRGRRVVVIGGGTGLSTLLRGLKAYTSNITAIVTVADDGGSSGRLRRELGILPPGDLRNNIAALARDEALMTQLLQYRFGSNQPVSDESLLKGHAFGNLLLAALAGLTGSFEEALIAAQRVLAIRGQVIPSTLDPVDLAADVEVNGRIQRVRGESAIPESGGRIQRVYLEPEHVRAYPEALRAILQADLVVIGPGSLYTSILPNLLVDDLAGALQSSRAKKVYVCNVATQSGETETFDVAAHAAVLVDHVSAACFDLVLGNSNLAVPRERIGRAEFVQPTTPAHHPLVTADLVDDERPWRHDSDKLAKAVMGLID